MMVSVEKFCGHEEEVEEGHHDGGKQKAGISSSSTTGGKYSGVDGGELGASHPNCE